jgi:membrane fusion protein (multidrug efflux system)
MLSHFSRSLRTIETDSTRPCFLAFILVILLLGLWGLWFLEGQVAVQVASRTARLEVYREHHPVEASVGGRVLAVRAAVGQVVSAGDAILDLDARGEQLAQIEQAALLAPMASQLQLLREELDSQQRAIEGERRAGQAALAEGESEQKRARAAADFAADEARRLSELHSRKLVSELDALRAANLATERRNAAESAGFAVRRVTQDLESREQDRLAQIARLRRDIADLEGARARTLAAANRLGYAIEERSIRAQVGGTIAELATIRPGSVVGPGTRIATIVPDGDLKVVAYFSPPAALGRIQAGQRARVRLVGFPWTQYGSTPARVTSVAGETHDGTIRVELALDDRASASNIPLQHGLEADVDVEVERASPANLVLRSVGTQMRLAAATQ